MMRRQGGGRAVFGGGGGAVGGEGEEYDRGYPRGWRGLQLSLFPPTPPPLVSAAATTSSDLEPEIPFRFGWKEAVATVYGYTKLVFDGFAQVYLLDSTWGHMGEAEEER